MQRRECGITRPACSGRSLCVVRLTSTKVHPVSSVGQGQQRHLALGMAKASACVLENTLRLQHMSGILKKLKNRPSPIDITAAPGVGISNVCQVSDDPFVDQLSVFAIRYEFCRKLFRTRKSPVSHLSRRERCSQDNICTWCLDQPAKASACVSSGMLLATAEGCWSGLLRHVRQDCLLTPME